MDKIAIGKVRTSTGVRGYFKVLSFSGEFVHFNKLRNQLVDFRKDGRVKHLLIEDVRMSGANLTMKAGGIDSPEEAKKFSGWEIFVEREKAAVCGDGEYYLADLCKCSIVLDGSVIGPIKGVSSNGLSDLLEVEVDGRVRLIPFLEQYVGEVDIDAGTVELTERWLLE